MTERELLFNIALAWIGAAEELPEIVGEGGYINDVEACYGWVCPDYDTYEGDFDLAWSIWCENLETLPPRMSDLLAEIKQSLTGLTETEKELLFFTSMYAKQLDRCCPDVGMGPNDHMIVADVARQAGLNISSKDIDEIVLRMRP